MYNNYYWLTYYVNVNSILPSKGKRYECTKLNNNTDGKAWFYTDEFGDDFGLSARQHLKVCCGLFKAIIKDCFAACQTSKEKENTR